MEPVVQWVGGKKRLVDTIKALFPSNFNNYYEPFLGGACLLLNILPENTVSVEKNTNIYNIYHNIKNFHVDIIKILRDFEKEYLEKSIDNRKIYYLEKRKEFNSLDYSSKENSIFKTSILLFLNKTCFNAVYRENKKHIFNVPFGNGKDCKICNSERIIKLSNYLNKENVTVVNGDFDYIKEMVSENDLVYLDPPYYPMNAASFTGYTNDGFTLEDNDRLIEFIKYLHNKKVFIILSNSNNQYFKDKLNFLKYYELSLARTLNCKKDNRKQQLCELIMTNINLDKNYTINNKNNVELNVNDTLDVSIVNKKAYYTFNEININLVANELKNILAFNKDKLTINVMKINKDNKTIEINIKHR